MDPLKVLERLGMKLNFEGLLSLAKKTNNKKLLEELRRLDVRADFLESTRTDETMDSFNDIMSSK